MGRAVMALMDSEAGYAVCFMDYVSQKKTVPFEMHAFTNLPQLGEYLRKRRVEILLIAEKDVEPEIARWPISMIVVLTETAEDGRAAGGADGAGGMDGGAGADYGSGEDGVPGGDGGARRGSSGRYDGGEFRPAWPRVFKYQASSAILQEVMEYYSRVDDGRIDPATGAVIKPRTKTVGVFSPVGRCGKTAFSMTLGQCLAKKKPTLLVNMESCSGLQSLLGETFARNISDAVYYVRQGGQGIAARLLPMVRELGGMSYLPPFREAAEVLGVTEAEWRKLLHEIRSESTYEALVLDLGEVPLFLPPILDECDVVYMPVAGDAAAAAKTEEYESVLAGSAYENITRKIRKLQLPVQGLPDDRSRWYEMLPYSSFGRCAEECIAADRL